MPFIAGAPGYPGAPPLCTYGRPAGNVALPAHALIVKQKWRVLLMAADNTRSS